MILLATGVISKETLILYCTFLRDQRVVGVQIWLEVSSQEDFRHVWIPNDYHRIDFFCFVGTCRWFTWVGTAVAATVFSAGGIGTLVESGLIVKCQQLST